MDDGEDDPLGVDESAWHVRRGEPGWMPRFYRAVVGALEAGYDVPSATLLLLLKGMKEPQHSQSQSEKFELMRYIDTIRVFMNVPAQDSADADKAEPFARGSLRSAVEIAQRVMRDQDRGSLNKVQRGLADRDLDAAYEYVKKVRSTLK